MTTSKAGLPQSLLLLLGSCLPILGAVLIAPILPRMAEHFAEHPAVAVLVPISFTIPALIIALFSPLAGVIADKYGRKQVLIFSMVVYGVFGVLPLWLQSLELILLSRAGIGLAEAGIMTCCTTLMGDYFDGKRRERLFAMQMIITSFSAAIFISLGGVLGQESWRTPFLLYASSLVILPFMLYFLWEPKAKPQAKTANKISSMPWITLSPYFILTMVAGISLFLVPVQAGYLLNLMAVESPAKIGMTMGANQIGVLIGAIVFAVLPRLNRTRTLFLSLVIAATGSFLMAKAQQHALLTVAVTLSGFGVGMLMPTLITCIMSFVSFHHRARATGVFTAMLFFGEFLSPLIVLAISHGDTSAIPQALLIIAIAQLGIAGLVLLRVFNVRSFVSESEFRDEISES